MTKKAIIIGAGYGGLALANLLGKVGWKVDVYEKNAKPGGRLDAFEDSGFTFDTGPSWYLMPEVFERYYQLFGESAKKRLDLVRLSPGYKVFYDHGQACMIQGEADADAKWFESIEPGAGNRLRAYVRRSQTIYDLATKHFLYDNYDSLLSMVRSRTLRYLLPLLSLSLTSLDSHVSKYFTNQRLKQILEYHMVFLGNSPFQAPAVYSLMSNLDFNSGVYYPKRGMMSLVDDIRDLGRPYDISVYCNKSIKQIIVRDRVACGVLLDDGTSIDDADIVISNADLHFTETALLDSKHQTYPEKYWKKRQSGPSALVVSLGVRGSLPQLQHHSLYFVDEWRENFTDIYSDKRIPNSASVYICNPNKIDTSLAPHDTENLFILVPLPAGVELSTDEMEQISDRILRRLSSVIGCEDLLSRIYVKHLFGPNDYDDRYNAWQYNAFGGESHLLSQSVGLRTANVSRKVKNLFYVGAGTQPGIGLPMCLISAELAFKRIQNIKSHGPLSSEDIHTS